MATKKDLKVVALRDLTKQDNEAIRFAQRRYSEKSASKAIITAVSRIEELEARKKELFESNMQKDSTIQKLKAQIHKYMSAALDQKEMLDIWQSNED